MAVRLSLGAGRGRVVRQLLTESLVVSVLGGLCGWLVAVWTNLFLVRMTVVETGTFIAPPAFPLDWRVFAFAASLSIATALLFGLAPALRATAVPPTAALATGSRARYSSRRTTMSWLVGGQVAMAMLLLIAAGLFGRTLVNLYRVDPGFDVGRVLSVLIDPRAAGYPPDTWKTLYRDLTERLETVPGVESVSTSQCPLLSDCNVSGGPYEFPGVDRPAEDILENRIGAEYFATVGIRLVAGREFHTTDAEGSPRVAIVSQYVRAQQLRQFSGIAAIGFDPLARLSRYEHDHLGTHAGHRDLAPANINRNEADGVLASQAVEASVAVRLPING